MVPNELMYSMSSLKDMRMAPQDRAPFQGNIGSPVASGKEACSRGIKVEGEIHVGGVKTGPVLVTKVNGPIVMPM